MAGPYGTAALGALLGVNGGRTVTGPVEHIVELSGGSLYVLAAGPSAPAT